MDSNRGNLGLLGRKQEASGEPFIDSEEKEFEIIVCQDSSARLIAKDRSGALERVMANFWYELRIDMSSRALGDPAFLARKRQRILQCLEDRFGSDLLSIQEKSGGKEVFSFNVAVSLILNDGEPLRFASHPEMLKSRVFGKGQDLSSDDMRHESLLNKSTFYKPVSSVIRENQLLAFFKECIHSDTCDSLFEECETAAQRCKTALIKACDEAIVLLDELKVSLVPAGLQPVKAR